MALLGWFGSREETEVVQSFEGKDWIIRTFALITLAYMTYYIVWRWTSTVNWHAAWFALPLVLAESYVVFRAYFTVFECWRLKQRVPKPAPPGLTVDVFITTYDESVEVLRKTALAARKITYPHVTWLLDDGRRDAVRELADELQIGYIRRDDNRDAKSGNLNNALTLTSGEFILQLDADHVPLPHILDRLLGFFEDDKLSFVQSPQDFYNTDSFMHNSSKKSRRMWDEQRFFFDVVLPGRDNWGAAFFCGSCGVIRRSSLEEIGGFQTRTITEDMETSLVLHSRGWKSAYYAESLAFGLAPDTAVGFHVQRLRWAQGTMQMMRKYNPITYPGLTLPQRLCYFDSFLYYLEGIVHTMFFAAPIIFLMTGVLPLRTLDTAFLVRFIPYLTMSLVMFEMLARGKGRIWLMERYNMARFFTYVRALSGLWARGKLKFNVTPKSAGEVPFQTYAPQVVLLALACIALLWGTIARVSGFIGNNGLASVGFWMSVIWSLYIILLAVYVIQISISGQHDRGEHRFADAMSIRFQVGGESPQQLDMGIMEDINRAGLSLRNSRPFEPGTVLRLNLPLTTRPITVDGEVMHSRVVSEAAKLYSHGVRFVELPGDTRDAIELHTSQHAVASERLQYRQNTDVFDKIVRWIYDPRRDRREASLRFPAHVVLNGSEEIAPSDFYAVIDELSDHGCRLVMDEPVQPDRHVVLEIPGAGETLDGTVMFVQPIDTGSGMRFLAGIMFTGAGPANLRFVRSLRDQSWLNRIRVSTGSRIRAIPAMSGRAVAGVRQLNMRVWGRLRASSHTSHTPEP